MKRIVSALLVAALLTSLAGCSSSETLTGTAKGFGGTVTVTVTREGDKITDVKVDAPNETAGIGDKAAAELPARIVEANSTDVDVIAGATITSEAILYAVNNALDPKAFPSTADNGEEEEKEPQQIAASDLYMGQGVVNTSRVGPGSDDTETPVYSFNQVYANALFDAEGRILTLNVDQLEVSTPNYDGASMPHFSGFPGQGGYNLDSDHDAKVDGKTEDTEENFAAEIASWQTKRERGADYVMGTGTWEEQMDKFQQLFVGMTVDEVEDWFAKYCSDLNGRPLKDGSDKEEDKAKYDALTDEEKAMLADVTSTATMSLNDSHGDILAAIRDSLANQVAIELTVE